MCCGTALALLSTPELSKLYENIKGGKNNAYKVNLLSKAFFTVDLAALTTAEASVKHVKEGEHGVFDLMAKMCVVSQFADVDNVVSWQGLEKLMNDIIRQRAYDEGRAAAVPLPAAPAAVPLPAAGGGAAGDMVI
jgi:hypothetical protein